VVVGRLPADDGPREIPVAITIARPPTLMPMMISPSKLNRFTAGPSQAISTISSL